MQSIWGNNHRSVVAERADREVALANFFLAFLPLSNFHTELPKYLSFQDFLFWAFFNSINLRTEFIIKVFAI